MSPTPLTDYEEKAETTGSLALFSPQGRDILESLPPDMTRRDIELVDYYIRFIPHTSFNIGARDLCNPFLDRDKRGMIRDPAFKS